VTTVIAVLLIAAALGELFGTLTVWLTYRRGVRVAEESRAEVQAEGQELKAMGAKRTMLAFDDAGTSFRITSIEGRFRDARRRVADQLQSSATTTVGLWAFVIGAMSGLAAGLVALYR
jgi:hypothetical protein